MTDKERIEAIMSHYNLNNVAFCTKVGLNQATLSNILGGRTNPSITVLRSIVDAFPDIDPTWMFMGEGEMFKSQDDSKSDTATPAPSTTGDLFSSSRDSAPESLFSQMASMSSAQPTSPNGQQAARPVPDHRPAAPVVNVNEIVTGVVTQLKKPQRRIVEVRIFFDDGTYETFSA